MAVIERVPEVFNVALMEEPAPTQSLQISIEAAPGQEAARRGDVASCSRAIEPQVHEAARSQLREQSPPPCLGFRQVMQDAGRFDHVEGSLERRHRKQIGLRVFDVPQADLSGLSAGVSQTHEAQVDGEHM